jgi:hypothetical protein
MERHNMALFTPVGQARELAAAISRLAAEAIADSETRLCGAILDQAQPESPDRSVPTVSASIGLALDLADQGPSGHDTRAPAQQGKLTRLPVGIGSENAPPATSSTSPSKDAPSAPSTRSSPARAVGTSRMAARSPSTQPYRPGRDTPGPRSLA